MIKVCNRCHISIEAKGHKLFCDSCGPIAKKEARELRRQKIRQQNPKPARKSRTSAEHKAHEAQRRNLSRFGGLREAVLERDNHQCRSCGTAWEPGSRYIVIHHLDHNKSNNTMDNLITLCRKCHPVIHDNWNDERKQKHSEAMKKAYATNSNMGTKGHKLTSEHIAKLRAANTGRHHTPEVIERMRNAKREWWVNHKIVKRDSLT